MEEKVSDKELFPSEEDTVPTEEEMKKLQLPKDLREVQILYYAGKNEEAEVLLIDVLKRHWNLDVLELRNHVAHYVNEHAEELATQLVYIVPNGDWSKCLNDEEAKAKYLASVKPEQWKVKSVGKTHLPNVWAIGFDMKPTETDEDFLGYAYVSENGKLKHVFAQSE